MSGNGSGQQRPVFKVAFVVEPDEGSFHAYCPALKGLHTCGNTREEALENAKMAAVAYLESLLRHGDPIPLSGSEEPMGLRQLCAHRRGRVSHTEDLAVAGC